MTPCSMKFAYASAANRPTICEPTGAAPTVDGGITTLPLLVFGPHSVMATGMLAGQLVAFVSCERSDVATLGLNIATMSVAGTAGRVARVLPAYQCSTAKSMLAQAADRTIAFQVWYCVAVGQATMPPILMV